MLVGRSGRWWWRQRAEEGRHLADSPCEVEGERVYAGKGGGSHVDARGRAWDESYGRLQGAKAYAATEEGTGDVVVYPFPSVSGCLAEVDGWWVAWDSTQQRRGNRLRWDRVCTADSAP